MRPSASILHLDLDAFFAAVEQRDKPSLRGKPVVVGGVGGRGVVATASYEARAYGARSAMSTIEARRRCPAGTAFLSPRREAYTKSSAVVMGLLGQLSPLVEQVSIDEAYVDLAAVPGRDLGVESVTRLAADLRARLELATGGLTASVGVGSSKLMAKIASELDKPDGLTVVAPGRELATLHPLAVTRLGGVGPATAERLRALRVETVGDLAAVDEADLVGLFGRAHGVGLHRLARAMDDRPVQVDREAKSVSAEETFAVDLTDRAVLHREIDALAERVSQRLRAAHTAGRTVTLKVRRYDFSTLTRSLTLAQPTDEQPQIAALARELLAPLDVADGVRLLGVGVSGLSDFVQRDLFSPASPEPVPVGAPADARDPEKSEKSENAENAENADRPVVEEDDEPDEVDAGPDHRWRGQLGREERWRTGQDVVHDRHGTGWVWGAGRALVTVRFEGPRTGPGPVHTFAADDPALQPTGPPDWA